MAVASLALDSINQTDHSQKHIKSQKERKGTLKNVMFNCFQEHKMIMTNKVVSACIAEHNDNECH